jgi:hypothetical protein
MTSSWRHRLRRVEQTLAARRRVSGEPASDDEPSDAFLSTLPMTTRRAWLDAMCRWLDARGLRDQPGANRIPIPIDELAFDPTELKDEILAALERWPA